MSRTLHISSAKAGSSGTPMPASKFRPPRLRSPIIARRRVAEALETDGGALTLLTGPPGCGKTTALAARYAAVLAEGRPAFWLTLGEEDNDPRGMTRTLIQAFGGLGPPASWPFECVENGRSVPRPPGGVDIFIDRFERIDDPEALALIEAFIVDLPDESNCYVTAHALRGGVLHDARLRGVVRRVTHDLFRFSDAEAAALLGSDWSPWEAQQLNLVADGWAAGLRFIALDPVSARKMLKDPRGDVAVPVEMAGYFDDVVCAALPEEQVAALMGASVLERFTAATLTDMPGPRCGWALAESHARTGMFLHYLGDSRRWIAFHPAFGQHMRYRLRCADPDRFALLQRFAATWFQEKGFAMEAIRHACRLSDPVLARRIMEGAGGLLAELGNGPFVNHDEPFPMEQARDLPMSFLSHVYLQIRTGHIVEARQTFEDMRARTRDFADFEIQSEKSWVRSFARIIEVVLDVTEDRPPDDKRIQLLEQMLADHVGEPVVIASVASLLSMAYIDTGRYVEAATICDIGLNAVHDLGATKVAIFVRIQQAAMALARDTVEKAGHYIDEGNRLARAEGDYGRYEVLATQILRAELHYEANELDQARALLEPALSQLQHIGGWVSLCIAGFSVAAAIAAIDHGYEAANGHLTAGEAFARQRNLPRLARLLAIVRMRELIRGQHWREATALLKQPEFAAIIEDEPRSFAGLRTQVPALLEAARLMIEIGRPAEAGSYLERIDKAYLDEGELRHRFTFRKLAMRVAFSLRRYNAAVDHMQAALELAMHAGLLRRAVTNRLALIEVFDWSVRNGRRMPPAMIAFVDDVLRNADGAEEGAAIPQRRPRRRRVAVTPNFTLSPRETEIIALVAEGYLTKEIATRLNISEGTVKSHRKKIHVKLGVVSKSQAIVRARELLII